MQKLFTVEIITVMVILLVRKGQSFKCYTCRSDTDLGCDHEHVDRTWLLDCPPRENVSTIFCRKINQKLKFKNDVDWTVIRECAYEHGPVECYYFKWVNHGYQETCDCAAEECNDGSRLKPNIMRVAVFCFVLGIFNYLNCDNT